MKRNNEAADAYGRAIALGQRAGPQGRAVAAAAAAGERARGRQPLARGQAALQQALALAPDQPLLLNFLGYAKLERGEDLDAAEAMIRKASELAPDDASITDSLGWAQFKRGKVDEAIATLAAGRREGPDQAEIQEHLGDALYQVGPALSRRASPGTRRWSPPRTTIAARVKAKLAAGLTPANAAP